MKLLTARTASTAVLIGALLAAPGASAATPAPEGFTYAPAKDTVMMGIGCEGEALCDTTQYWIGDRAGSKNVGSIPGPTTPANEIFYQAEGEALNTTDFPADAKFSGRELIVRTDAPLAGQVTLNGYGNAGFGAFTTVDVRIDARNKTTNKSFSLAATATDHHLPGGALTLEYSVPLDPAMDGDTIVINNLNLTVRGFNVLTGFVNGTGESYFELPTYDLVATTAP